MSKQSVTRASTSTSTTSLNNDSMNNILDKQLKINEEVKQLKYIIDEMAKFTEEKNEIEKQLNENMDDLEEKEKREKQQKLSKRYNDLQIKIQYHLLCLQLKNKKIIVAFEFQH